MLSRYLGEALKRARYQMLEDGTYCATVPGLRGVVGTGATLEGCRETLAEVIEEWVLVRVAGGLTIPSLGTQRIRVPRAG